MWQQKLSNENKENTIIHAADSQEGVHLDCKYFPSPWPGAPGLYSETLSYVNAKATLAVDCFQPISK